MCWVEQIKVDKTRKVFQCEWCWQIIELGSACFRHRGVVEGRFFTARIHPECNDAMNNELEYCETYIPGAQDRPQPLSI